MDFTFTLFMCINRYLSTSISCHRRMSTILRCQPHLCTTTKEQKLNFHQVSLSKIANISGHTEFLHWGWKPAWTMPFSSRKFHYPKPHISSSCITVWSTKSTRLQNLTLASEDALIVLKQLKASFWKSSENTCAAYRSCRITDPRCYLPFSPR